MQMSEGPTGPCQAKEHLANAEAKKVPTVYARPNERANNAEGKRSCHTILGQRNKLAKAHGKGPTVAGQR